MYMNRIAPIGAQLYIANADGSNETALMGNQSAPFDYHANWSPDGQWIVFSSERRADGQSDLYRVRPDGTGLETLVQTDAFEDAGSLSPDGTKLAYVSTSLNYTTNIFVKDLTTGVSVNVTGSDESVVNLIGPHSFFRPTWSPDGEWIALSSDAGTDWTGHSNGTGWEHTQTLSIYVVRPNGTDYRKIIGQTGYCLGSPNWSSDSTRLVYYNLTTEDTYSAHGIGSFGGGGIVTQLFSVDVATGLDVVQLTTDSSLKVTPRYIGNSTNVGYVIKSGEAGTTNYTTTDTTHQNFNASMRNPSWSPDGTKLVYEVYDWSQRQAERELFSWDSEWEYRFMDVFPMFNNATGQLATTEKQLGNASSSAVLTGADYDDLVTVFDVFEYGNSSANRTAYADGTSGAFQPSFRADGSQIAVGYGTWFSGRAGSSGSIYVFDANGTNYENVTDGVYNAGFPSFSPDGTKIVYRLWDYENGPLGLRVLDLETGNTTQITDGWDNTPGWSPSGELIVFTRQTNWTASYGGRWYSDRFDICTIKPDGTELTVLTESNANDAHAVWSADNRIIYNSGMYGFRDESPLYDNTFQPYGQIVIMNADGTNKTMLTDSMWEDSMPLFVNSKYFD
ncbi:hypothetical protein BX600DRAFT_395724 [Xylariales sp. PMI_506]|nr:hypothetical protein BX600DRAFT_395724 [Xylariales sp. PMI_506]